MGLVHPHAFFWYTPLLSLYRKTSGLAYREKPPGFYRVKPAPKIGLPGTSNSRQSRHLSQAPPLGLQPPLSLSAGLYGPVLAVKGSLRRFAPWTAPGRSERRAAYEGKGGVGPSDAGSANPIRARRLWKKPDFLLRGGPGRSARIAEKRSSAAKRKGRTRHRRRRAEPVVEQVWTVVDLGSFQVHVLCLGRLQHLVD